MYGDVPMSFNLKQRVHAIDCGTETLMTQTDRKTGRQTDRQTDKQPARNSNTETDTDTNTNTDNA